MMFVVIMNVMMMVIFDKSVGVIHLRRVEELVVESVKDGVEWQMMLRLEVEMVMMQVIMEMVVHHVFDVISMKMMLVLHMVQHVVAMIIKMNAMTLVIVGTKVHHLGVVDA